MRCCVSATWSRDALVTCHRCFFAEVVLVHMLHHFGAPVSHAVVCALVLTGQDQCHPGSCHQSRKMCAHDCVRRGLLLGECVCVWHDMTRLVLRVRGEVRVEWGARPWLSALHRQHACALTRGVCEPTGPPRVAAGKDMITLAGRIAGSVLTVAVQPSLPLACSVLESILDKHPQARGSHCDQSLCSSNALPAASLPDTSAGHSVDAACATVQGCAVCVSCSNPSCLLLWWCCTVFCG